MQPMLQRMQQQLAANAHNNMQFNDDIDEYLKDGDIDALDDYNDLRMTTTVGVTRIASSPTVVVKTPQPQQTGIVNLARHKDFGFNLGDDTDQISSYRKSSLPTTQQQQQIISESRYDEPAIKPVKFDFQKKAKEQQKNVNEEDSEISVEHRAPQVLKMKRSEIEKSQQEDSSYSEEQVYKPVEHKRKESKQTRQQRKEKSYRQYKSRRQQIEPSLDTQSSMQDDTNNSFDEYDYYQPRPTGNKPTNASRQQYTTHNQYTQPDDIHKENYTTININKNTRGPNAVKTLTVQKVKKQVKPNQNNDQNQYEHQRKSGRTTSESIAPQVDLQDKKKKKDVSFSEKLEKSISDLSEQQNIPGQQDPADSNELLQQIEDEGNKINNEFHEEINLEPIGLTGHHNSVTKKTKSNNNYISQLNINDLNGFNNSVDDQQFDLPVYQQEMDMGELAIQQENEQRRRRISSDESISNLKLSQIVNKPSKDSRQSKTSKKTSSREEPVKQPKKRAEREGEKRTRQPHKQIQDDSENSLQLSADDQLSSSIYEEYNNLVDTQSQSYSIPKKSKINLIRTAQVEESGARTANELIDQLFECVVQAAANQQDLLNKKLATYTTPFNERELITIKLKDGAFGRKRISIRKILGEEIIYSNGEAVQIKLCCINNEAQDNRKLNNAQEKKPFPQRFLLNLRKVDSNDDTDFIYEKNKRTRSINPVTRFEKYEFEQMAPGCYKAGISQVDRRQQEIITIENGKVYEKQRYQQTVNLFQASGESEIILQGSSKQSYKLRQYDSFIIPSGIQFSIKQIYNKTSVLILSSNVESEK